MLAALYDQVSGEALGTLQQMEIDETRSAIDIAISRILRLPDLAPLRTLLGQEPIICGASLGPSAEPVGRDDSQLEFELIL
jgi:hypothetical protein